MPSLAPLDDDRAWLATLSVLYVEDEDVTRHLLARFLQRRVGRVLTASSGADGLALFRAERPAMVITDIQMPGMDGLAMAEEIRRTDPAVPVVVTTAFEQIDYLERSIEAGVDKYVTKPVDADKLEAALVACAHRHRAEALLTRERRREIASAHAHQREALGLLAGGMAHDFNNLLQAVLGNIDLALPLTEPGTELRELLDAGMESIRQAVDLGRKLITLSDSWATDAHAQAVGPVLRAAIVPALADSRIRLALSLPADLPDIVHDPDLLGRAFTQLARNAREAMPDGGELSITAEARGLCEAEVPPLPAGRYLQIAFRDSGRGIAPEILPRVFDPYFTTKRRGSARGTGLGLALCSAIVRKHGGIVTAAAGVEKGAVFTVFLPLASPSMAPLLEGSHE